MKISVFGTGYVGLVAAVCFADAGNHVVGVDIDESKIARLRDGQVPIYEPGLDEILKSAIKHKRIEFTTDAIKAIRETEVIFVAVGTPEGEDGSADLRHVLTVCELIAKNMNEEKTIVLKSTVPVGTAEKVSTLMKDKTTLTFHIVSNPEFLKEGASIEDFLRPDRVIVGCTSEKARAQMTELYAPFVKNGHPVIFMKNKAAELTKYAANAFLATKISFINEMAALADAVGADIEEVKKGFTSDSRINPAFFYPGVGYGGSCFPKDVKALVKTGREFGVAMDVVSATDKVNENQRRFLTKKVRSHYKNLKGLTLSVWGLSFKPRTDDIREAPAFSIIEELLGEGVTIKAYDPVAMENTKKKFGSQVELYPESMQTLKDSDGLLLLTEWNEFRSPDFKEIKKTLKQPVIFDGRNVYEPAALRKLGFTYYCIGRDRA
jgi:UDPglucose 6-dehydrogenase